MSRPAYLLPQLLTASAEANPEAIAVIDGDQRSTYRQLDEESNRLARALIEAGVARGDRVGVYMDKSISAVASLYAVMKAGAAYVPLDPSAPAERLKGIAENCAISCLVTAASKSLWPQLVADLPGTAVVVQDEGPDDALAQSDDDRAIVRIATDIRSA